MKYHDRYLGFREELWQAFDQLVRKGATFSVPVDVRYPYGENPPELLLDTEGRSSFLAKGIKANSDYELHVGEDIIVGTGRVVFIDWYDTECELEPDILDLSWLSELLDAVR